MAKIVNGRQKTWQIRELIGHGDAGEVLRVQSPSDQETGVLKRPLQNVSGGTIVRQAVQIENEGRILAVLSGLGLKRKEVTIHTPFLLDESIAGTSQTANMFIVSEEVPGQPISGLLKNLQQGNGSISQVLVLKVLVGLFQLLDSVHARGIIWNDVKMEHIYWNPDSKTLSFIDWGNGRQFDPESDSEKNYPLLDYTQLISEGTLLLNQVAPDLIPQLDWPENNVQLDFKELPQLRQRIEFMESYLSMRVLDYQIQFRKNLQKLKDPESLENLFELMDSLERLGIQVDHEQILESARNLALVSLDKANGEKTKKILSQIQERFPESFGVNWTMANSLLADPALTNSKWKTDLVKAVLGAEWFKATSLLLENTDIEPTNYSMLVMAMRSASNNINPSLPTVYELLQNLRDDAHMQILRFRAGGQEQSDLLYFVEQFSAQLDSLVNSWTSLNTDEMLGDKFLKMRDLLDQTSVSGLELPPALMQSLTILLSKTREVFQSWLEGNLEKTRQALISLFLFEPSQLYLKDIYQEVSRLQKWLDRLASGPQPDETLNAFARDLQGSKPGASRSLGLPVWLGELAQVVDELSQAKDLNHVRVLAQQMHWPIPWIENSWLTLDIPREQATHVKLNTNQALILERFHDDLRSGRDLEPVLQQIRSALPEFYYQYFLLSQEFTVLFSSLTHTHARLRLSAFPITDRKNIDEALKVLGYGQDWKKNVVDGKVFEPLPKNFTSQWKVVEEIGQTKLLWQGTLLPILTGIKQKHWDSLPVPSSTSPDLIKLLNVTTALGHISRLWSKVPSHGIFPESVLELDYQIELAMENFFTFWQGLENNSIDPLRFLARENQPLFSNINQALLQISRYLHTESRSLEVVTEPSMARTRLAQNSAGDLMFALVQLDNLILPKERKKSPLRQWQKQYLDLLKQPDRASILAGIQSFEPVHPLLPWFDELVSRDIDFFEIPKNHQW